MNRFDIRYHRVLVEIDGYRFAPPVLRAAKGFFGMVRRVGFMMIVVLFATAGTTIYLNVTGFCYSQAAYLGDADLTRRAIQISIEKTPTSEAGIIRYGTVEAFIERNRNCCVVHRHDRGEFENVLADRWVRLFGWYVLVVDVWYQFKEEGPNNFSDSSIAMTSCGQFVGRHTSFGSRPGG